MPFSMTDLNAAIRADKSITGFEEFRSSADMMQIIAKVHGVSVSLGMLDFMACYGAAKEDDNLLQAFFTELAKRRIYYVLKRIDAILPEP